MRKAWYHPDLQDLCKDIADWRADKGFRTDWHNIPEKLMLIVTELSEAMEAYRHLEGRTLNYEAYQEACPDPGRLSLSKTQIAYLANFREELADTAIRLFDLAGSLGIDLPEEIATKMAKNESRPQKHGKER